MAGRHSAIPDGAAPPGQPGGFNERLRAALADGELFPVFQPQADVESGRITGWEALARWRLADGTMIPPDLFIPLAEDGGSIAELGDWILRRTCAVAAAWLDDGLSEVPVAVNLSARQLDPPGFAGRVLGILAETGLPAAHLKLELTETAPLAASSVAWNTLRELRGAGVGLVLDDFGTGHSSLALLRRIPLEAVKIDRGFVAAMIEDHTAATIVQAVIALAHALGLTVIAEGVETDEQRLFLRAHRCDRMQGYLLARPMAEPDARAFIATRAATPTAG